MSARFAFAMALIATAFVAPAGAQQSTATGNIAVTSDPGSATVLRTLEVSAEVVAIDKASRKITLKQAGAADTTDVIADKDVRNFDQIKVGDTVSVRYLEALALELQKTKIETSGVAVNQETARAPLGQRPGGGMAYEVSAIADVVDVDPQKGTITLKGPRGNIVALAVRNPEQFKVVKKGDQIAVTYTEAVAVSVEPASQAPSAKPKN